MEKTINLPKSNDNFDLKLTNFKAEYEKDLKRLSNALNYFLVSDNLYIEFYFHCGINEPYAQEYYNSLMKDLKDNGWFVKEEIGIYSFKILISKRELKGFRFFLDRFLDYFFLK